MSGHRVVVTGLGPVTSVGVGAKRFHVGQSEGRSGVRTISRFDPAGLPVRIAAEVDLPPELELSRRDTRATDRCTQLASVAATLALQDSGLDLEAEDRSRIGVAIGSGAGGTETTEHNLRASFERADGHKGLSARFIPSSMVNSAAAWVTIQYGLTGPSSAAVTACASGADSLVAAHQMIATGEADVVLAGGTEAPLASRMVGGFAKMRALSTRNDEPERASRPFSADRDGFVLGEGAAVLVLESAEHAAARGAVPLAEFRGYGRSSDAYHVTAPRPDGTGAARAVTAALRSARLDAADVGYVNAHGTGTTFNDAAEAQAIRLALGDAAARVPVSATKSLTGHTLGASGAIEAVASVQALIHNLVPPTANLDEPDAELGLNVVGAHGLETGVDAVLSNSFAFGGHNVVLAFTRG
ncbi:3-oxoacyl-[acyl-carrier-protein] synthase II [Streptomyces olivoverticillatus]|uniref:3-oxoacyl-[acyl-carrier-protein] synthase 2 n=1 Tax=Streptomyces olivoverticillatus TaxID=66427 RepID=A0A7W7LTU1_9ACTN|nr:beta-ketoacyl-ACP synthase II [Streptomyces olivoverticillatus]MBB4895511.1 3-oxoacyl-[acyl-carrier-protein] synthase II [Streptomyces olivoverticillatus]